MKSRKPILERSAFWLSERTGSDQRVAEIRSHLADSVDHGQSVAVGDVVSLLGLALRFKARSLPLEVAKSLVVAPFAFFQLILLGITYETHFPAWDFVGPNVVDWTSQAVMWNRIVNVMAAVSVVFTIWALRRVALSFLANRVLLPAMYGGLVAIAASQIDRFVDRADWYRDHEQIYYALTPEHVNHIQPYSIALFTAFAAIPLIYIVADLIAARRRAKQTPPPPQAPSLRGA